MGEITDLIKEAEDELGLDQADAARMLFVVLAKHRGWTNARISRYLGVSRARVGQKANRNKHYLEHYKLSRLKKNLKRTNVKEVAESATRTVAFHQEDWQNPDFAVGMLNLVASAPRRAKVPAV